MRLNRHLRHSLTGMERFLNTFPQQSPLSSLLQVHLFFQSHVVCQQIEKLRESSQAWGKKTNGRFEILSLICFYNDEFGRSPDQWPASSIQPSAGACSDSQASLGNAFWDSCQLSGADVAFLETVTASAAAAVAIDLTHRLPHALWSRAFSSFWQSWVPP